MARRTQSAERRAEHLGCARHRDRPAWRSRWTSGAPPPRRRPALAALGRDDPARARRARPHGLREARDMSLATRRLLGIAALLAVALVVSWAWTNPATRSAARACCLYRPSMALHHGRVWTVVTSAFLLVNPHPFGTTVLFSALVLVPYA